MENTTKKYGKTLCFTPMICYQLWVLYCLYINRDLMAPNHLSDHVGLVTNTIQNYGSVFVGVVLATAITATILICFIVHLARLKDMDDFHKIGWIVFMTFLAPVAFIVFWYTELRHEPDDIRVYPTIT
jgi:hypothetical protein